MKDPFTDLKVTGRHRRRTPDEDPSRTKRNESPMTFFTPDLYRQFGLGFLIGTAMLAAANADALSDQISPAAQAAEAPQAPAPAPEFLIQPID